jgi:hypothetical protein
MIQTVPRLGNAQVTATKRIFRKDVAKKIIANQKLESGK